MKFGSYVVILSGFKYVLLISELHPLLSNKTKEKQFTGGKKGQKRGPKQQ